MIGSEKQIVYAETLRDNAIKTINEQMVMIGDPERLRNKSTDGKTKEQLDRRAKMIIEMEERISEKNDIIKKLINYVGYAGHMIDAIKMQTWSMKKTQVGYHDFMKNICGYKRENEQWIK